MNRKHKNKAARGKITQETLLYRMTNRIRQSLALKEILSVTVDEMRSFLGTDRVKVYQFHADGSGQVIAESVVQNRLPSLLNLHFPAGDIPPHAREMFLKARLRSIVDVPQQRITLSQVNFPNTTGDLTVEEVRKQTIEEILQRPVDPCHVQYLTAMGVQSSLVVPILHQQKLWGLLAAHHSQPKTFKKQDLQIVQMIADQVSIAIAQSHLFTQSREKARRESFINQISTLLHSPLKIQEILQIVLEKVTKVVKGSGGRLYLSSTAEATGSLYTYGIQPELSLSGNFTLLEDYPFWQELMTSENQSANYANILDNLADLVINENYDATSLDTNLQVITDIYQEPELFEIIHAFQPTRIRSILAMPLNYAGNSLGCLTIFRNEIDTDILWAGKFDPDERNSRVRDSFETWRELKLGQSQEWTEEEIELVRALANHLSIAMMQHLLYEYEHKQLVLVEMRNKELSIARTIAEKASRFKSDFLSSTSHELRTPLAATLNYLKLLQEGFYDNEEELKEYIDVAYKSAETLVAIINDVLDIAKIEAGRMNLEIEQINLPLLLENKCKLFSLDSRHKGISLIIECEVDSVYADQVKLKQILINLLYNAFKFTEQGEVRVRATLCADATKTASCEQMVEISVSDTGIGIDIDIQDILFEPFVQAEASFKRRYGGTGLGLTICKQLVELMGGKIWLESPGIGQGTTVIFTLPYKNT